MARVIKRTRTTKPAPAPKKTSRTAAAVRSGAKTRPVAKPGAKPRAAAASPKLTVAEMRIQLEKLTKANTMLRAKNRDVMKSAKASEATIAALQERVATLEGELATHGKPAASPPKPRRPRRSSKSNVMHDDTPETAQVTDMDEAEDESEHE